MQKDRTAQIRTKLRVEVDLDASSWRIEYGEEPTREAVADYVRASLNDLPGFESDDTVIRVKVLAR